MLLVDTTGCEPGEVADEAGSRSNGGGGTPGTAARQCAGPGGAAAPGCGHHSGYAAQVGLPCPAWLLQAHPAPGPPLLLELLRSQAGCKACAGAPPKPSTSRPTWLTSGLHADLHAMRVWGPRLAVCCLQVALLRSLSGPPSWESWRLPRWTGSRDARRRLSSYLPCAATPRRGGRPAASRAVTDQCCAQ